VAGAIVGVADAEEVASTFDEVAVAGGAATGAHPVTIHSIKIIAEANDRNLIMVFNSFMRSRQHLKHSPGAT
jgi:hypothetical protein